MSYPTTMPLRSATWCLRNGYTEPQKIDGQWWAFAPKAVMPTPIPYLAKGLKPIASPYTLKITLLLGTLLYRLNQGAIVAAAWQPNQLYCYQYPHLSFSVGLDLLEVSPLNEIKWRVHLHSSGVCPNDWRCYKDDRPGLVLSTIALSIQSLTEEETP